MRQLSHSLRYTTAMTLSLMALSATNQAEAACTPSNGTFGNDTIACTGTSSGPINLSAGTDSLTNSGTLSSGGTTINASGSGAKTIDNSGTISSTGSGILTGSSGTVTNQAGATISATGTASFQGAIAYGDGGAVINNSGSLLNTGGGNAISFSYTGSGGSGAINNLAGGVIRGDRHGIGHDQAGTSGGDLSGAITNAGTIEGTTGAGVLARALGTSTTSSAVASFSGGIVNTGTIVGNTGISVQANTLGDAFISSIANSGTIEGTGGTAIDYTDITAVSQININGGRIIGDVVDNNVANGFSPVVITGSGFATEGDFTVSSLAVNAGQSFTISTGDVFNTRTMSTAGTINFEVDAAGAVGALNVTAGAIDLTGGSVGAVVDSAAALTDGQEIQIGTGTAALIGTTGAVGQSLTTVTDDSLLFDFAIADGGQADITGSADANNLFFLVSQVSSAGQNAITGNGRRVGTIFNRLEGTSNPQLSSILSNIGNASTSQELEGILQATLPTLDNSASEAAQSVTGNTLRIVSDRLTVLRDPSGGNSGISSGDITENLQLWSQAFGQNARQGERGGVAGYDSHTRGITFGVDTEGLHEDSTVGLAFSYADTSIGSDSANNTATDVNSYNVAIYADYAMNDLSHLIGSLGYTYGDNKSTRFNVGGVSGLNADSDYGSHQIEARGIVNYDYHPNGDLSWHVIPAAQVHYIGFQNQDINETGAGGANLNTESEFSNVLEFGLGIDLQKEITFGDGGIITPEVNLGYRYDVLGESLKTTSTFEGGGASFVSEGADPAQGTWNLGLGLGLHAPNDIEVTVIYGYEHRDKFNAHSALFRAAIPF